MKTVIKAAAISLLIIPAPYHAAAQSWANACNPAPVQFLNLPIVTGVTDSASSVLRGGVALHVVSGRTQRGISGGVVRLAKDTGQFAATSIGAITKDGVAIVRDLVPGSYWLSFDLIGYQPFFTEIAVAARRVDTVRVSLYDVTTCLGR